MTDRTLTCDVLHQRRRLSPTFPVVLILATIAMPPADHEQTPSPGGVTDWEHSLEMPREANGWEGAAVTWLNDGLTMRPAPTTSIQLRPVCASLRERGEAPGGWWNVRTGGFDVRLTDQTLSCKPHSRA